MEAIFPYNEEITYKSFCEFDNNRTLWDSMFKGFYGIDLSNNDDQIICLKVKPPLLSLRQTIINKKSFKN